MSQYVLDINDDGTPIASLDTSLVDVNDQEDTRSLKQIKLSLAAEHSRPRTKDSGASVRKYPKRSYAIRALAHKAVSYQKRQLFNNICCVGLCPMIMILTSFALGTVLQDYLDKALKGKDILYCSNMPALTSENFPITDPSDPFLPTSPVEDVPGASGDVVNVNYLSVNNLHPTLGNLQGGFGFLQSLTSNRPCVYNFAKRVPYGSNPYSLDPKAALEQNQISLSDATYTPEVLTGWLSSNTIGFLTKELIELQLMEWYIFATGKGVPSYRAGSKERVVYDISGSDQALFNFEFPKLGFDPVVNRTFGLLSTMETRIFLDVNYAAASVSSFDTVPYFERNGTSSSDMDALYVDKISNAIETLKQVDKSVLTESRPKYGDLEQYFIQVTSALSGVPYGAIVFNQISFTSNRYDYILHVGKDSRMNSPSSIYPSAGFRQLLLQSKLSSSILRNSAKSLGNATITQSVRAMPLLQPGLVKFSFASYIGGILYPFGVSFLLPLFVVTMVTEKEAKISVMMRMNGLPPYLYNLSQYVTFYLLYAMSAAIFIIFGYITKLELFSLTSMAVQVIFFFTWGHAQISLSFFLSSVMQRSRLALVISFLAVLISVIVSIAVNQLFKETDHCPNSLLAWPPLAFYRGLFVLNKYAYNQDLRAYTLSDLTRPTDEVRRCILALAIEAVIFYLLACYVEEVLPKEFGVAQKWWFPLTKPLKSAAKFFGKNSVAPIVSVKLAAERHPLEDADVHTERVKVSLSNEISASLCIRGVRKVFPHGKVAVSDFSLMVDDGCVLGLLGPNGAGKTTLISILTGLHGATRGDATLAGYDLRTELALVQKSIGVCPQYDILWDDITVREHLLFYARLKGVAPRDEQAVVNESLKGVSLEAFADRRAKGLSGGERRRLSIAIALIGSPGVVFLDEPTTGLDPEVRRVIWNIINNAKEGKSIVLTTHSMEEAEICCSRIGIMSNGVLRCLGTQRRLKHLYGTGFKIHYTAKSVDLHHKASSFVESLLPRGFRVLESFSTTTSYEFAPKRPGDVGRIFRQMESGKESYGIAEWGISETTMDEVFLRIIDEEDASAHK